MAGKPQNLTGQKFGRLTAVIYVPTSRWICHCDCGKTHEVAAGQLKSGRIKSCGCAERVYRKQFGADGRRLAAAVDKQWFFSKCSVDDKTGCWNWIGNKYKDGYGMCCVGNGKQERAHRVAYRFWKGDFNDAFKVLHRCDNPACCNPDHLFLGTNQDNMIDCSQKSRHRWNKVTPDQVRLIRSNPAPRVILARQFSMTVAGIRAIQKRASYDWVK